MRSEDAPVTQYCGSPNPSGASNRGMPSVRPRWRKIAGRVPPSADAVVRQVGPAVIVEVGDVDPRRLRGKRTQACLFGDVAERRPTLIIGSFVEVEPNRHFLSLVDRAVVVLAEHDICEAVAVDVGDDDAGPHRPHRRGPAIGIPSRRFPRRFLRRWR